jgi:hypothetical protein
MNKKARFKEGEKAKKKRGGQPTSLRQPKNILGEALKTQYHFDMQEFFLLCSIA